MLSIIGIASAYPENVIHNEDLGRIQGGRSSEELAKNTSIKARRTSLPLSYLHACGNSDIWKAPASAQINPTQLGMNAVKEALASCNESVGTLGLILGDCSTPLETTPGEGQRIAAGLGIKGKAFDICACSCALSAHLDALNRWREEMVPEVTVCVSTNVPTQNIDYKEGVEGYLFGDAASAVVVSTSRRGALRVEDAWYTSENEQLSFLRIGLYDPMKLGELPTEDWIGRRVSAVAKRIEGLSSLRNLKVILPPLFEGVCKDMLSREGVRNLSCWSNAELCGDSLGSYSACVLAERWNEVDSDTNILILQVGPGASFGSVLLKGQEV